MLITAVIIWFAAILVRGQAAEPTDGSDRAARRERNWYGPKV